MTDEAAGPLILIQLILAASKDRAVVELCNKPSASAARELANTTAFVATRRCIVFDPTAPLSLC